MQQLGLFGNINPTNALQDNRSAISLSSKGVNHKRFKHFGIEFDALREKIKNGEIKLEYLPTEDMHADMLTKSLPRERFERHKTKVLGEVEEQRAFV